MESGPWLRQDAQSDDEEEDSGELEGTEEEGDDDEEEEEKDERKQFMSRQNVIKSVAGSAPLLGGISSEEAESEEDEEGVVGSQRQVKNTPAKGENEKFSNVVEYEVDSDTESDSEASSEEEMPRKIADILANERKSSVGKKASGTPKKSLRAAACFVDDMAVAKSKPRARKRLREEAKTKEDTPGKRKEHGGKIQGSQVTSTPGGKGLSHSQAEALQVQNVGKEEKFLFEVAKPDPRRGEGQATGKEGASKKKSRKQKRLFHEGRQTQDSEGNGERETKRLAAEKNERGTEMKVEKKGFPVEQKCQKLGKESPSSQKQKKATVWSSVEEVALLSAVLHLLKEGCHFPPQRGDQFWAKLNEELRGEWTRDQLYEKLRRMKIRYQAITERMKQETSKPYQHKSVHDEDLFMLWKQIWSKEEGVKEMDEKEQEEADEEREVMVPKEKLDASGQRNKDEKKKVISSPRGNRFEKKVENERKLENGGSSGLDRDEEHARKESATPVELVQRVVATSAGTCFADATMDNGPLQSSVDLMKPDQKASVLSNLLNTGDGKLPQQGAHDMKGTLKLMKTWHEGLLREIQRSCKLMLGEVQTNAIAAIENTFKLGGTDFQFHNWLNVHMPGPFPIPFLKGGDDLNMKLLDSNETVLQKLRQQWHEQNLQELKVFSQRLHLIQEQCRLQQEHLEKQLGFDKV
eukprot:c28793_g1_i2 orf=645-2720(-)